MFEIKKSGLIVAKNKKEMLEGLKAWKQKRSNATKIFPSGVVISFFNIALIVKCKCEKDYYWYYFSKIPSSSFRCENCNRLLISYIRNRKYSFISR